MGRRAAARPRRRTQTERTLARRLQCASHAESTAAAKHTAAHFELFLREQLARVSRTTDAAIKRARRAWRSSALREMQQPADFPRDFVMSIRGNCGSAHQAPRREEVALL